VALATNCNLSPTPMTRATISMGRETPALRVRNRLTWQNDWNARVSSICYTFRQLYLAEGVIQQIVAYAEP
jgi:hypothetical protein